MADFVRGKDAARPNSVSVNQAVLQSGQMDMSGFRIGKQRLVSKKKRTSQLKKVILEEREYNKLQGVGLDVHGRVPLATGGLSLDAPEFVPMGWGLGSSQGVDDAAAASPAEGGSAAVDAGDSSGAAAPAADIFLPSWCQGGATAASVGGGTADAAVEAGVAPPSGSAAEEGDAGRLTADEGQNSDSAPELPVSAALQRLSASQDAGKKPQERKQKKAAAGANIEVRHYVHQVLSDDLDEQVKFMLGELARYQERAKERDPLKFQKQKRYCVGMRECQRAVARSKAKCIICAPNLEECGVEGGLDDTMEDLIEACREADVPVVFALSRNRIGKALGKNIRLSVVCILSAEGAHQELKAVLKHTDDLRRQWVLRQMANLSSEDAEAARRRSEERELRNQERRLAREKQEAERKAEEERRREEARVAKELMKAQRQAAHQAEMERRRALKAQREEAAKVAAEAEAEVAKQEALRQAELEKQRRAEEAELRRKDAARRAEEEKRKAAEAAAAQAEKAKKKAEAAAGGEAVAEESDAESDSSGSSVPLGFNSALF